MRIRVMVRWCAIERTLEMAHRSHFQALWRPYSSFVTQARGIDSACKAFGGMVFTDTFNPGKGAGQFPERGAKGATHPLCAGLRRLP